MEEKWRFWIQKEFTFEYIYIYIKLDEEFMEGKRREGDFWSEGWKNFVT